MSLKKAIRVEQALKKARQALENGEKRAARENALRAADLNPQEEEAWLILAAVSHPAESIEYLKTALQINPASKKARKGIRWAIKELRESQATQQIHKGISSPSILNRKRTSRRGQHKFTEISLKWEIPLFAAVLLVGCTAVFMASIPSFSVQAASRMEERPKDALFKPTLTPTATPTPTQTPTPLPTTTPRPEPTQDTDFTSYTYHSWDIPEEISDGNTFWIEIDLTNQMLYAHRGNQMISGFVVSTGTSSYKTVTGTYKIYAKYPKYTMAGPGYYLEDVPYSMFFHKGYAVHGTYWHNNFGTPMSHGCVNMVTSDAAWVYDNAPVGTYVFVHY